MIKERLVGVSLTTDKKCICDPIILLGTNQGLWDLNSEKVPRGTLFDLNAAWELFLSKKGFKNIKFNIYEHPIHEVIDGVVYEQGDITYTLEDNNGNPTKASFTIRLNTNPVKHMESSEGNLYLYYDKVRPLEDKDEGNPVHYVLDEDGNIIVDPETGKPLIYDYVKISILEVFDNNETRKLFPWKVDDENNVILRNPVEEESSNFGNIKITPQSEIYINDVNTSSINELLKKDLGFNPIINDGECVGSDLLLKLNTTDKTSIVNAVNEIKNDSISNKNNIEDLELNKVNPLIENISEISGELISIKDSLEEHINDKNNPHDVKATQLDVIVSDKNNNNNSNVDDEYLVQYNVDGALKEVFNRINLNEDSTGLVFKTLGSAEDIRRLDLIDEIEDYNPTLIGLSLETKNKLDQITPIPNSIIDMIIV